MKQISFADTLGHFMTLFVYMVFVQIVIQSGVASTLFKVTYLNVPTEALSANPGLDRDISCRLCDGVNIKQKTG